MNQTNQKPLPPGKSGLPFIGETIAFLRERDFAIKRYQQYGPIFRTHLMGRPTVVMAGPEANQFLLANGMDHFAWESGWPNTFKELLGRSLFLQDGDEHKRNRRLITPAFHGPALAGYLAGMDAIIRRYLDTWATMGVLAWFTEFKKMTFEVACALLIGTNPNDAISQLSQDFTDLTNGLFTLPIRARWTPYGKALAARDRLLAFVDKQITLRQQNLGQDALSLLLQSVDEEGNQLSREELKAQVILLLFAGHETTTSMLTSFCMLMAQHPEVWAKAREEQTAVGLDTPLTIESLRQMPFLDRIFREVERLHPPVAGGFRGTETAFDFNGYHIPAGWQVVYNITATHYDPAIYPNPYTFDPDRFDPARKGKQSPYALVGFGGGPRTCIGKSFALMEMKVTAVHLLRHYTWEILPGQNLEITRIPTTRPKDNLLVQFKKR